jgi:hypothetical protein
MCGVEKEIKEAVGWKKIRECHGDNINIIDEIHYDAEK